MMPKTSTQYFFRGYTDGCPCIQTIFAASALRAQSVRAMSALHLFPAYPKPNCQFILWFLPSCFTYTTVHHLYLSIVSVHCVVSWFQTTSLIHSDSVGEHSYIPWPCALSIHTRNTLSLIFSFPRVPYGLSLGLWRMAFLCYHVLCRLLPECCQNLWLISTPLQMTLGSDNVPTTVYLHPDTLKAALVKSGWTDPLWIPLDVSTTCLIDPLNAGVGYMGIYPLFSSSFKRLHDISLG